uniref:RNA-directed RNA polymerase L n=1 Tax=Mapputta virus TaxID=1590835 RepID=A0A0R7FK48_9VIRU|nr:RNA-dependent RNA polymerase [Mapputta virus]
MDPDIKKQLELKIMTCRDPAIAREIHTEILEMRHDYFGKEICKSLNLEYRNDVPLETILQEVWDDYDLEHVPFITPDNFLFDNNCLYIIDYKVSVSMESSLATIEKYNEKMEQIGHLLPFRYEIVIIKIDPYSKILYINSDNFQKLFNNILIDVDFTDFIDMRAMLLEKFQDDEDFVAMIAHGDFTMTSSWTDESCEEYKDHPVFKEFKYSMPIPYRRLFEEAMTFNAYKAERWNTQLIKMRDYTRTSYNDFITEQANKIKTLDGTYPKPDKNEIMAGWRLMRRRIHQMRELTTDPSKQKPSGHFIWSPPSGGNNNNIAKILLLSRSLQSIKDNSPNAKMFNAIGKMMDFSADVDQYIKHIEGLKNESRRLNRKITSQKLEPKIIGSAKVLWEQQFVLNNDYCEQNGRQTFYKKFLGIGGHKKFQDKTTTDLDMSKPEILDFDDKTIILAANAMIKETDQLLYQESIVKKHETIFDSYMLKIKNASEEMHSTINAIMKTNYWNCLNDISILIKNLLSVAQYNKYNTFRVVLCANNNMFGLLFPSGDIKTRQSTLLYCIVALHKDQNAILDPGALYQTFKIKDGYLSVSRAMRLDKARCQRLVASPGLFLLTSALFKGENSTLSIREILTFAFYTSVSITKAMLSLTEPARYMMMNSLAISSHVKDYIAEKFSPYTKTLFSAYVCNLIKKGCIIANNQKDKIEIRDIYMTDFEMIQKGVKDVRELQSIWFNGKVNLKEFINEIYLPFYFNAKGLHEKHHVLVDLAKTIVEIELEQRQSIKDIWSSIPKKQTVNLAIFTHALSKSLILDTARHNHLRSRVENRNNLRRSITTISTFTSSKSCIEIGSFKDLKSKQYSIQTAANKKQLEKMRVANPLLIEENEEMLQTQHSNYNMLVEAMPNYQDFISIKVFDALYKRLKHNVLTDGPCVKEILKIMKTKVDFFFTFFNKEQKTYVDREIFVGEFEAKMCMYLVERIAKERCKLNPEEMISEPGDGKLKVLESRAETEARYLIRETAEHNKRILDNTSDTLEKMSKMKRGFRLEINADMSKWSAQDVMFKFFWLTALDPILYPEEKEHIIYFYCNYLNKKIILPDNLMCNLLDQKILHDNDILAYATNGFTTNAINIKRNWLQGNFNYTSSYLHSVSMQTFKDIIKATLPEQQVVINSLVHSDDNQTSLVLIQDLYPEEIMIEHILNEFEIVCLTFGCQANMKKTYATNLIKEFVSLFNICGEPFSVYGRFLLTSASDCAFIGPYEDFASRISAAQAGIKHGCPPSLAWLSIAIAHWMTATTYNMLPGQANDPSKNMPIDFNETPIELGGPLQAPLYLTALIGLEANKIYDMLNILKKLVNPLMIREEVAMQVSNIHEPSLHKLTEAERFKLKLIRYLVLKSDIQIDDKLGETCDMRSRSILTPRKFTTVGILKKLESFNDHANIMSTTAEAEKVLDFMIENPELLVTKGETKEQYLNSILYRYNSRRFKESLSIQNPVQLFIEQILFSLKPTIDYNSILGENMIISDTNIDEKHNIIGNVTIAKAMSNLYQDINEMDLTLDDIKICFMFTILNDPLIITAANSYLLSTQSNQSPRLGLSCSTMPEFRNMKLIHHSPALVLRAYCKKTVNLPGIDPVEMQRDLNHLEHFIAQSKLEIAMNDVLQRHKDDGTYTKQLELRELTKFYQTAYDYIKSTEHKIKVYILPHRAYTTIDFCALLQGNLIKDSCYINIHYLKQITSSTHKGEVKTISNSEIMIAKECFRALAFFLDTFISLNDRVRVLETVIDTFTFKSCLVKDLYNLIKTSQYRYEFLPLLYRMNDLTQADIDRYEAMKSDDNVVWNQWQVNRMFDKGDIDLIITGKDKFIRIIGSDDNLRLAELHIPTNKEDMIKSAGRRLLNQRHGLRFERMKEIIMDEKNLYIAYQKRQKNQYYYMIQTTDYINNRNSEIKQKSTRDQNLIVPVCLVYVAVDVSRRRVYIETLEHQNHDNYDIARLRLTLDEYATIKRAQISKVLLFDGPEITSNVFSITKLMKTHELLEPNFDRLLRKNIIPLAKIFKCSGHSIDDFDFSEQPMEADDIAEVDCKPIFSVIYPKKGNKKMTYKNAILSIIDRELTIAELELTLIDESFFAGENRGLIEAIVALIDLLESNEWSTILKNIIHMLYLKHDMDAEFHLIECPEIFKQGDDLNVTMIEEFIHSLPKITNATWSIIFENFKDKIILLINDYKEKKQPKNIVKFSKLLKKADKSTKGLFSFF